MQLVELEIPARPEFVSLARLVVGSIAGERYELSDDQLDDLKLAVSEACVVAINADDAVVSLTCDGFEDHLKVNVRAGKAAIDASTLQDDVIVVADGKGADVGLPLISTLVDELTVEEGEGGDRICLTVRCARAEEL